MTQKGSRVYTLISGATLIHFYIGTGKKKHIHTRQFHYAKRVISRTEMLEGYFMFPPNCTKK